MTSSTTAEVHNVLHWCQRKTVTVPLTAMEKWWNWTCGFWDMRAYRHTDRQTETRKWISTSQHRPGCPRQLVNLLWPWPLTFELQYLIGSSVGAIWIYPLSFIEIAQAVYEIVVTRSVWTSADERMIENIHAFADIVGWRRRTNRQINRYRDIGWSRHFTRLPGTKILRNLPLSSAPPPTIAGRHRKMYTASC